MLNVGCLICKHRIQDTEADDFVCLAYPKGIPRPIVVGEVDHEQVLDDQKGNFVFEPADPELFAEFFPDVPVPEHQE